MICRTVLLPLLAALSATACNAVAASNAPALPDASVARSAPSAFAAVQADLDEVASVYADGGSYVRGDRTVTVERLPNGDKIAKTYYGGQLVSTRTEHGRRDWSLVKNNDFGEYYWEDHKEGPDSIVEHKRFYDDMGEHDILKEETANDIQITEKLCTYVDGGLQCKTTVRHASHTGVH